MQFLLKQAGVDKRTGDLYGNRDFMNIARNMARGLKVCLSVSKKKCSFCFGIYFSVIIGEFHCVFIGG